MHLLFIDFCSWQYIFDSASLNFSLFFFLKKDLFMCVNFLLHVCMCAPPHMDSVQRGFSGTGVTNGCHPVDAGNQRATSERLSRPCFFVFVLSAEILVVWIYCNLFVDPVKAVWAVSSLSSSRWDWSWVWWYIPVIPGSQGRGISSSRPTWAI